jgi:hypothetical protein
MEKIHLLVFPVCLFVCLKRFLCAVDFNDDDDGKILYLLRVYLKDLITRDFFFWKKCCNFFWRDY